MLIKVFFLQFMLASILLWSPVASQQIDNSNPVTIPPYVIPPDDNNEAVCPRGDPEILSELETTIRSILAKWAQDNIPCGGPGWRQVVFINMTDLATSCPPGFELTSNVSRRVCGSSSPYTIVPYNSTFRANCQSTTFSTGGSPYAKVCGRVRAYSIGYGHSFRQGEEHSIDNLFVEGLTLTHGSPGSREHIWTFAAGIQFDSKFPNSRDPRSCPCVPGSRSSPPSFVGNDYFCDSVEQNHSSLAFFPDNPLWDGQGCPPASHPYACACEHLNPPWFTKTLQTSTTDDIEMRHCSNHANSHITPTVWFSTPFELIELYVQ